MDNTRENALTDQWVINVTVDARDISQEGSYSCNEDYENQEGYESEDEDKDDETFVVKCNICPICQEEATDPSIVLECGHIFDEECFKDFLTYEVRNGKTVIACPFCRSCILEVESSMLRQIPRTQHTLQSEQIEIENRQQSVFRQRCHEFLMSRCGRYCVYSFVEVIIIGVILLIIYASSCNKGENCVFTP